MPRKKIQPIYKRPFIAQARTVKGWSQSELGEKVGKSKQAISDYERGTRDPDYQTACAILRELDLANLRITIDDFYPKAATGKGQMREVAQ